MTRAQLLADARAMFEQLPIVVANKQGLTFDECVGYLTASVYAPGINAGRLSATPLKECASIIREALTEAHNPNGEASNSLSGHDNSKMGIQW